MANARQLAILKRGVEVWNDWREENPNVRIDLNEADYTSEIVELTSVNLFRAELRFANLLGVNLTGANLMDAHLRGADLTGANLDGANLTGAILTSAKLSGTDVRGANFDRSLIGNTIFAFLDLSQTSGLESAHHSYPSVIGTQTFLLSKGRLPAIFLRGCGLSDWEIEEIKLYDRDLSNDDVNKILYKVYDLRSSQAIQISPLFISYSHDDSDFVDKLEDHLMEKGIRFWRDTHQMKAGRIETQIDRGIRQNPTVLLVLSKHSLASDWVEHEIRTARELEKEIRRDVLCPVALDDSWKDSRWPKRMMEQILEYNILDFSAWKDDKKFESIFNKLNDGLALFYKF